MMITLLLGLYAAETLPRPETRGFGGFERVAAFPSLGKVMTVVSLMLLFTQRFADGKEICLEADGTRICGDTPFTATERILANGQSRIDVNDSNSEESCIHLKKVVVCKEGGRTTTRYINRLL